MPDGAVFLDRDGTICEHVPYLATPEKFELRPTVATGIRRLNEADVPVIVTTNQSGVGRGYFDEETVRTIHTRMYASLKAHDASITDVYFCPHHPDDDCPCRKPNPGMLLQAAEEHDIVLEQSYIVGDRQSDADAGANVGCTAIAFPSAETDERIDADHVVGRFVDAVDIVLS